jgi:hypothetical protein
MKEWERRRKIGSNKGSKEQLNKGTRYDVII